MPSSHADRCEPADKTGIATTGCEEDGVDMGGVSTQDAAGVCGSL